MPLLLKFSENYADEFDVYGFIALSEQDWEDYKTKVRELIGDNTFDYGFGTNESIDFNDADSYIDSFNEKKITDEEYAFLLKNFNRTHYSGWDGKEHTVVKTIVEYGHVPFYNLDDLQEKQKDIEQRNKDRAVWEQGNEDGKNGVLPTSTDWNYKQGHDAGVRFKKYGY